MKKIVAVMWHNSANKIRMIQDELSRFIKIKVYSAHSLDEGQEDINQLYHDMEDADLLLFNMTSSDSVWTEIEEHVKDFSTPVVYIGSEAISKVKTKKDAEIFSRCNEYYNYSGTENLVNMFLYLCNEILSCDMKYELPKFIPWDGIFSLNDDRIFESTKEYFEAFPKSEKGVIGLLVARSSWINDDILVEKQIIREIEKNGYTALPIYTYSMKDDALGTNGPDAAVEQFCFDENSEPLVDAMIRMASFFSSGASVDVMKRLNCPVIKPICSHSMTVEEWEKNPDGTISDIAWSIALPELDGVIEPIFIGAQKFEGDASVRYPVQSRVEKLVNRLIKWIELNKKSNKDKKIVFVLNNNPCVATEASVGGGANLDTLESVVRILNTMKDSGYLLENIPENGDKLIEEIMSRKAISDFRWTTVKEIVTKGGALAQIDREQYMQWFSALSPKTQDAMIEGWGEPVGEAMVYEDKLLVTGVSFGNALVCVQPKRGCLGSKCDGVACKILHDPHIPPTHQYFASYRWFEYVYGADAIIHMGTHGNLEFLPGKSTALSDDCFPDICIGNLPFLYVYNADNPSEATIAKRRSLSTTVNHMQTTMIQGGLYDEMEELEELLNQYEKTKLADKTQAHLMEHLIIEQIKKTNNLSQINLDDHHNRFNEIVDECHKVLSLMKNTQIQDGIHIIGLLPQGERRVDFLNSIVRYEGIGTESLRSALCSLFGLNLSDLLKNQEKFSQEFMVSNGTILLELDEISKKVIKLFLEDKLFEEDEKITGRYKIVNKEAIDTINSFMPKIEDINRRIDESDELKSLQNGMNGGYISPGPGGIVTRGRDDILPTGRNIYTLDPEKVPTKAAWEIGKRLTDSVINKFLTEENRYPENMAFYWMAGDVIWGDGEGLSQMLYLLGAKPVWLANGKVKKFEIIPLEELKRPRIDLTVKITGILRDNFQCSINLLDDAVRKVAKLNEPLEMNFVRKHALESMEKDLSLSWDDATSRIFGSQPGTYSAGVNLMVYASAWEEKADIANLFMLYNQYAYGREKFGKESLNSLKQNMTTVDLTFDRTMSDERDLLGCCCYFGNHGGLTAAAKEYSANDVKTYYGDTREPTNVEIRTLTEEINRVVTGKLLNPKWIEGKKRHGYKGAGDISKRVGRVYGWDAATDAVDDWVFNDITKTFIQNKENREFFMENNPWALEEMSRRLIEAYERNLWAPEEGLIEEIRDSYLELEGFLEEDMGNDVGEFQGGSIDIVKAQDLELFQKNSIKLQTLKKN